MYGYGRKLGLVTEERRVRGGAGQPPPKATNPGLRALTWKRSGGTCFFTKWLWTCSVALFEKGWRDRGGCEFRAASGSLPNCPGPGPTPQTSLGVALTCEQAKSSFMM